MIDCKQDLMNALYRNDPLEFSMRCMSIFEPGTKIEPNWHHKAICYAVKRAFRGEFAQLVINQPPKTMKTHLVSISAVAWRLIKNPELKFAIISHDEVLASKILRAIRQIMKSTWYQNLAPNTKIKNEKDTESVFETTAGGEVRAFSINGGITGHGFDVIIIDDPQKASTAYSETERKNVENAYSTAIANRWRNPAQGILIIVMQRLHLDDFTNYILKVHPKAHHLSIPVKADKTLFFDIDDDCSHEFAEGELLEPDRMHDEFLRSMRVAQGSDHFDTQYLQNPQASAGRIIKPEWLRSYIQPRQAEYKVISIDPAFSEDGTNSAAIVVNLIGEDVEIIHAEQCQVDPAAMLNWINRLDVVHQPDLFLIETIGSGILIPYYLKRYDSIEHVAFINTHKGKSKIERMEMVSPLIEAGRLWLPEKAHWRPEFEKLLTDFPYGTSTDWPDCVSQLLLYYDSVRQQAKFHRDQKFPPEPPIGERRWSPHYQRIDYV
jgi:hypothetical protein